MTVEQRDREINFTPQDMSASVDERLAQLAKSIHGILGDEIIATNDVMLLTIPGGIVANRQRTFRLWRDGPELTEDVDIRVELTGYVSGRIYGPTRFNTVHGDSLAPRSIFGYLLGICEEVGIQIVTPETHKTKPRT